MSITNASLQIALVTGNVTTYYIAKQPSTEYGRY